MKKICDDLTIEWCAPRDLSLIEIQTAAGWIRALDMDFYNLFHLNEISIEQLIAQLLFNPLSEFSPTLFVRHTGLLAGLVTWFTAGEMFTRRILVLKELLAASIDVSSTKARLENFEGASRRVPLDALYLSKIYVAPEKQGHGLGTILFARFLGASKAAGRTPILHVRRDNRSAIAFYEAHGLREISDNTANPYFLMAKL